MKAQCPLRVAGLMIAMRALPTGLCAGLLRLGWPRPTLRPTMPGQHGPLMVSGFLGTLFGLERTVERDSRWAWLTRLSTAMGVLTLLTGAPGSVGPLSMTVGSLEFVASGRAIMRCQPALFTITMVLRALAWLAAIVYGSPAGRSIR